MSKPIVQNMIVGISLLALASCKPNAMDGGAGLGDSSAGARNLAWVSRGPCGGGEFFAPSFNPRNPSEMWVSSDTSPVLHTTNLLAADRQWTCVSWSQFNGGCSSFVRYTSDPHILYGLDGLHGPIKSIDGGATWNKLPGWKAAEAFDVRADPQSSTRLIVAGQNDIFLSTDGGDSFTSLFSSPNICVAGAFFDSEAKTIYLGTNAGLLKSANDGRFAPVDATLPQAQFMICFAGAKDAAGTIRLMCVTGDNVKPGTAIEMHSSGYKGIYSLDIGQKHWTPRMDGIAAGNKLGFVAMVDNNINTIYAAGRGSGSPTVYKISDASKSWKWESIFQNAGTGFTDNKNIFTGWEGDGGDRGWSLDEVALDFTVDPGDVNYAAVTGEGFLHYTTDGGASWHPAYTRPAEENPAGQKSPVGRMYHNVGMNDTAVQWVAWADRSAMFAGFTDIRAARSTDAGVSWTIPNPANLLNTQYVILPAPGGALYAANCSIHDVYQTWSRAVDGGGTGNVIISIDKGANWNIVHKFANPVVWIALDDKDATGNTMYASVVSGKVGGIYKTTNLSAGADATWTLLAAPPRTEGHPYNIRLLKDGSIVASYGDRFAGGKFTPSSGVFYSSDGGKTWVDRSDPKMLYYTRGLTIDPTDPAENTWYAATRNAWGGAGEHSGGFFRTTDRGQTWKMVYDCSFEGAESCTINPATREIFLATESHGLMYAPDTTAKDLTFVPTNYPYSHPYRIFINPYDSSDIWIASYGIGISEARLTGSH